MEEVFKDYFINWRCPRLKISNTGKLMVNGIIVKTEEHHDGRHFFFMHHKLRCLEIAMLKLFPELREYYDKFGYKKINHAAIETIAELKRDYTEGLSVKELSDKYRLTEKYVNTCVSSIPKNETIFLSEN